MLLLVQVWGWAGTVEVFAPGMRGFHTALHFSRSAGGGGLAGVAGAVSGRFGGSGGGKTGGSKAGGGGGGGARLTVTAVDWAAQALWCCYTDGSVVLTGLQDQVGVGVCVCVCVCCACVCVC